jgi:hypothetical protein
MCFLPSVQESLVAGKTLFSAALETSEAVGHPIEQLAVADDLAV